MANWRTKDREEHGKILRCEKCKNPYGTLVKTGHNTYIHKDCAVAEQHMKEERETKKQDKEGKQFGGRKRS